MYLNGYPVRFDHLRSGAGQATAGVRRRQSVAGGIADGPADQSKAWRRTGVPASAWWAGGRHVPAAGVLCRSAQAWPRCHRAVIRRDVRFLEELPAIAIGAKAEIVGSCEAGTQHEARITVANPLPYEVQAVVDWKLADYFGKPIAGRLEKVTLKPHTHGYGLHAYLHRPERGPGVSTGPQDPRSRWFPTTRVASGRDDRGQRLGQTGTAAQSRRPAGDLDPHAKGPYLAEHRRPSFTVAGWRRLGTRSRDAAASPGQTAR